MKRVILNQEERTVLSVILDSMLAPERKDWWLREFGKCSKEAAKYWQDRAIGIREKLNKAANHELWGK